MRLYRNAPKALTAPDRDFGRCIFLVWFAFLADISQFTCASSGVPFGLAQRLMLSRQFRRPNRCRQRVTRKEYAPHWEPPQPFLRVPRPGNFRAPWSSVPRNNVSRYRGPGIPATPRDCAVRRSIGRKSRPSGPDGHRSAGRGILTDILRHHVRFTPESRHKRRVRQRSGYDPKRTFIWQGLRRTERPI